MLSSPVVDKGVNEPLLVGGLIANSTFVFSDVQFLPTPGVKLLLDTR